MTVHIEIFVQDSLVEEVMASVTAAISFVVVEEVMASVTVAVDDYYLDFVLLEVMASAAAELDFAAVV